MTDKQLNYSSYIAESFIERKSNLLVGLLIKLLYGKFKLDRESISLLKEYSGKGKIVYTTLQTTNSSLLLFIHLLRKHGFTLPEIALGFSPYIIQHITNTVRKIFRFFFSIFRKGRGDQFSNKDYVIDSIAHNHSLVLSLLSQKLFFRRFVEVHGDTLEYLVEAQKQSEEPIFIMPYIFFWNLNPKRSDSFLTSKATGDRRLLTGAISLLKSPAPAFVRFAKPINIAEEIKNSSVTDSGELARSIRNKLLESYSHEQRSVLGPVIKSPQEMMEKVLYHKNVLDVVEDISKEKRTTHKKLRRNAVKYFKEIAADLSLIYVQLFLSTLDYVFNKLFDGIYYDEEDIRKIREASKRGPLVLVPSHRSHLDYLILTSMLYKNRIAPPHVVAGANLTFFPMGTIFRRSGAFFMRRSFKGLDLYASVFKQYVKTLVNEGYSIEFFIEGTRTRTGKIEAPRYGILKYLVDAVEEGFSHDLIFVPISINYDRVIEESSFQKEVRGKEKKSESTSGLLKSRKLLGKKYGRVYMRVDDPVSYQDLKKAYNKDENYITHIGEHLITAINKVSMVSPSSLVTSALLLNGSQELSLLECIHNMNIMYDFLRSESVAVSDLLKNRENFPDLCHEMLKEYETDQIVNLETLEDSVNITIKRDERTRINFYKNNIIFYFLPYAFTALGILKKDSKSTSKDSPEETYQKLMDLFSGEFIFPDSFKDTHGSVKKALGYFHEKKVIASARADAAIVDRGTLLLFARFIQDFLESYFIAYSAIDILQTPIAQKDAIYEIRKQGMTLLKDESIHFIEALSIPNYRRAISKMIESGILSSEGEDPRNALLIKEDSKDLNQVTSFISTFLEILHKD